MKIRKVMTSLGLVALGAVAAGTGTAAAATGGTFILGKGNAASTTTTLKNTGTGATLTLPAARTGQPPLAVSAASGRVPYLNVDKLDNLDSTAFALALGRAGSIERTGAPVDFDGNGTPDAFRAYAPCPAGTKVTGGGFEVFTTAGAVVNRAEGNGWLVMTSPDADTVADDVVAVAQCYNPRGAVGGSIQQYSADVSTDEQQRLLQLAERR